MPTVHNLISAESIAKRGTGTAHWLSDIGALSWWSTNLRPVLPQISTRLTMARVAGAVALALIAACSQVDTSDPDPKTLTLADLKHRDISVAAQTLDPVSAERVLATYDEAVSLFSTKKERALALRRMADMTMVATEDEFIQSLEEEPGTDTSPAPAYDPSARYGEAIAMYEAVIQAGEPGDNLAEEYYLLAKAYDLAGEPERALETLNTMVERYPENDFIIEAQFRRGEQYFQLGEFDTAASAYQFVLDNGQNHELFQPAVYKHGWSLYKLGDFDLAVADFAQLLDRYWESAPVTDITDLEMVGEPESPTAEVLTDTPEDVVAVETTESRPEVSGTDQKMMDDTLRVMSMSFANMNGAPSAVEFFDKHGPKDYEQELFEALAALYLYQERFQDAADTYSLFVETHPLHPMAPAMSAEVIATYAKGGFPSQVLAEKERFVERYGAGGEYWEQASAETRSQYAGVLKQNLIDLAQHYHAIAQETGESQDYQKAASWYRNFLETFPGEERAPVMNMLLAEALFAAKDFQAAIVEFEKTAYDQPKHKDDEKAGYFSLLAYQEYINTLAANDPTRADWISQRAASSLRYAKQYPDSEKAAQIIENAIEDQLALNDIPAALETAQYIIAMQPPAPRALQEKAWITVANAQYDEQQWAEAEQSIQTVLGFESLSAKQRNAFRDRLGDTVYKQAEKLEQAGDNEAAVAQYLRVANVAPESAAAPKAEYDAATLLLKNENYEQAISVLEGFRAKYPKHELISTLPAKLSLAYEQVGNLAAASTELLGVAASNRNSDPELARQALYQAATMKEQTGATTDAIQLYKDYVWGYERPIAPRMEAMYKLAQLYEQTGDLRKRYFWLNKLVETNAGAGAEQTDRSQYLAAYGSFHSADALFQDFNSIRLTQPLKTSLTRKKKALQQAADAYTQTIQYGIAEFSTAATFKLGALYQQFARSIMNSERPRGLDELALEEYELLLEDQAFPLEDKAIAIYRNNTTKTAEGFWDQWIEDTFAELAKLSPGRFDKQEQGEEYVDAIY